MRVGHTAYAQGTVIQRAESTEDKLAQLVRDYIGRVKDPTIPPTWPQLRTLGLQVSLKAIGTLDSFKTALRATPEYQKAKSIAEAKEAKVREQEEEQARLKEEKRQQTMPRRRWESLARLLETTNNVCVAIAVVHGTVYAATNDGPLAQLQYKDDTLQVENLEGRMDDRWRTDDAAKVSAYIHKQQMPALSTNTILQVGDELGHNVHAEMKLLNTLVKKGVQGQVLFYISKMCCDSCRAALTVWNDSTKTKLKVSTRGSHGNSYPGWDPPPCIQNDQSLSAALHEKLQVASFGGLRGRNSVQNPRTRTDRSPSPAPKGAKTSEFPKDQ